MKIPGYIYVYPGYVHDKAWIRMLCEEAKPAYLNLVADIMHNFSDGPRPFRISSTIILDAYMCFLDMYMRKHEFVYEKAWKRI